MNRRTLLAGMGATAAVGGLAGCVGGGNDDPDGVWLPRVELGNFTEETIDFDVLIEYNGENEFWSTFEIEPTTIDDGVGAELIDPDLPEEAGEISVEVRVENHRTSIDFTDEGYDDGDCVIGIFLYGFRDADRLSAFSSSVSEDESLSREISCPNRD